jgi:hypothetical protein
MTWPTVAADSPDNRRSSHDDARVNSNSDIIHILNVIPMYVSHAHTHTHTCYQFSPLVNNRIYIVLFEMYNVVLQSRGLLDRSRTPSPSLPAPPTNHRPSPYHESAGIDAAPTVFSARMLPSASVCVRAHLFCAYTPAICRIVVHVMPTPSNIYGARTPAVTIWIKRHQRPFTLYYAMVICAEAVSHSMFE